MKAKAKIEDKNSRKNIGITVDPVLWRTFRSKCVAQDRKAYEVIEELMQRYIKEK